MFGDPWRTNTYKKIDPMSAALLFHGVSDAICKPWRKDAEVSDSVPSHYDSQIKAQVKHAATPDNYKWCMFERQTGLVRRCRFSFGEEAVIVASLKGTSFVDPYNDVALLISVTLESSRIAVLGPRTKCGTTERRLYDEITTAARAVLPGVQANVLFFYSASK